LNAFNGSVASWRRNPFFAAKLPVRVDAASLPLANAAAFFLA
jgi:hypothetical protein